MTGKRIHEVPIDGPEPRAGEPAEPGTGPEAGAGEESRETAPNPREALEHLQRLQAEFSNYRRRVEKERSETAGWAQSALAERLLPVLDDFERAFASADAGSPVAAGFRMVEEKLRRILTESGLEKIRAEGEEFDPDQHEALMTVPVSPEMAGRVVGELEAGYRFQGRLLRPARVQVGVEEE